MLEALGSPGERSILSEKKRRTGTGDGEEGKPASFQQEESQAGRDGEEKPERRLSSHSAEVGEEQTGQRSCHCSCQVFSTELASVGSGQAQMFLHRGSKQTIKCAVFLKSICLLF